MKIKISNINIFKFFAYTEIFLIIYSTGSLAMNIGDDTAFRSLLKSTMWILAGIFVLLSFNNKNVMKSFLFCTIVIIFYYSINVLHYAETSKSLLSFLIRFLLFIFMLIFFEQKHINVEKIVFHIILFIALIALLFYVLINILHINLPYTLVYLKKIYNYEDFYYNYFNIYAYRPAASINIGPINIIRLSSMFWEPGIYGIYISLALYYYIFKYKQKNQFILLVLLINGLLTFSTTCIIIMCFLFLPMFFLSKLSSKNKWIICWFIIPTVIILMYLILKSKMITSSGNARVSDLLFGLKILAENFLLGTGYNNTEIFTIMQGKNRGNSNGLVTWLFTMGIFGVFVLVFPFLKNLNKINRDEKKGYLSYCFILILCNMTEPIITFPFMSFLIAIEYKKHIYKMKLKFELK